MYSQKIYHPVYHLVYRFFIILALTTSIIWKEASARSIDLRLKPAPPGTLHEVKKELKIGKSAYKVGKKLFKNGFKDLLPKVSGFVAIYGGYIDYSNEDGSIQFPLLHKEKKIYLVITPEIKLTNVFGSTISHKNFIKDVPAEVYLLEKKKNDETQTVYWRVTKEKKPDHNRINPLSIVLLTRPKNLVVSTGDFITPKTQNFILPGVYVVGNSNNAKSVLNFLDIRHFFEQIDRVEKAHKKTLQKLIINK